MVRAVEESLPTFVKACGEEAENIVLHQDAFAADYQLEEFLLLGMAVKYAGIKGKTLTIVGKNRETLK